MSVLRIESYRRKSGEDILKVILKPTKVYPKGYFYCDACDEGLVRNYTWYLQNQKAPYIVTLYGSQYRLLRRFHREKAFNILSYYPDYINHVNGIEFDNIDRNLDVVSQQQNRWCTSSRGYFINGKSFQPYVRANQQNIYAPCVKTEPEACIVAYNLELTYEDYHYNFLADRRNDLDILDDERTGRISAEEAVYRHVVRYASDNAWYIYRYNLFSYFKENHIPVPAFSVDSEGFMVHPVTGKHLCPF